MNFSLFERPSRYINSEVNSVKKSQAVVSFALAFPDIYDVGMSHLGLKILYKIINDLPYAVAERAFHPWLDLEDYMKKNGIPLASLETGKPLRDFDILGFSFQYELSFTSVLNMLSLSKIPLRSEERAERDPSQGLGSPSKGLGSPLVIAGGPSTMNPLPMSPFIDAFLIGDGEDAVKEIAETAFRWKTAGDGKKHSILKALSEIEGVYVPSISKGAKRRFIGSLDEAPYPTEPPVPYTQIVHDRVNIEISRGCPMGCRYCQAGMIYRPVRERSPQKAIELAELSLKSTGYEEVSFTSLSAGDYSCLVQLLREFNRKFSDGRISVSLPSLRVKAVNPEVLREIKSVRKTGFTIAPEAATERLRAVINKDFGEEDYEAALENLFREGWLNLKLYYMIGLPTETDKDIEAIPEMVRKALRTAKSHTKRFVNISVSVSPFVPKPHTAFQWCGQESVGEIRRKKEFLRGSLKNINIKGHDERMSLLEAAFARGDERLSALLEAAWQEGSRLDGWTEAFDFALWQRAMEKTGIDASSLAAKTYGTEDALPWEIIDTGVDKKFLMNEYNSAIRAEMTEGCMDSCAACGIGCEAAAHGEKENDVFSGGKYTVSEKGTALLPRALRLRAEFSKTGVMRYLSHRELMNLMPRAMRRAGVLLDYTKGFHPSPKLAFGPPLNVGVAGLRECFDMEVLKPYDLAELKESVNASLREGVCLSRVVGVRREEPSLQSFISRYEYEIICPDPLIERFREAAKNIGRSEGIWPLVEYAEMKDDKTASVVLRDTPDKKVKLDEVARELFGSPASELEITRVAVYGLRDGGWEPPILERGI